MPERGEADRGTVIQDLSVIPSPYLSGVFDLTDTRSVELVLARGCGMKCSYCAINETPLRYFPFERFKAELDYVTAHAPKLEDMLVTVADMYGGNDEISVKALTALKEAAEKYKFRVLFYVNVLNLDKDFLLRMSDCEYFDIEVGIQSLNPNVLRMCHRLPDPEKIKANVENLKKLAPRAQIFLGLISCLPGDTEASYLDSLEWAISTRVNVGVNHLRIIPDTELYRTCAGMGFKVSPVYPYFVTKTDKLSEKQVSVLTDYTTDIFFALRPLSFSEKFKTDYFATAEKLKTDLPHIALARFMADWCKKRPDSLPVYERYIHGYMETGSLDHDPRTSFMSDEAVRILYREYGLLKNMLKKRGLLGD